MLIKTIAGISLFALAGGAIGYSKILCAGGECSITGTSYGGALFGSILGLAVMSSLNQKPQSPPPSENDEQSSSED